MHMHFEKKYRFLAHKLCARKLHRSIYSFNQPSVFFDKRCELQLEKNFYLFKKLRSMETATVGAALRIVVKFVKKRIRVTIWIPSILFRYISDFQI